MQDKDIKDLEMFYRLKDFGKTHNYLYPSGSYSIELLDGMVKVVTVMGESLNSQLGQHGVGLGGTITKMAAKDLLTKNLKAIRRTARLIGKDEKAFEMNFILPKRSTERELIATAQNFLKNAATNEQKFIKCELAPDFLAQLESYINQYEALVMGSESSVEVTIIATTTIKQTMAKGRDIAQRLDAVMKNKLKNDPIMMEAWKRARRTEKVPRTKSKSKTEPKSALEVKPEIKPEIEPAEAKE